MLYTNQNHSTNRAIFSTMQLFTIRFSFYFTGDIEEVGR